MNTKALREAVAFASKITVAKSYRPILGCVKIGDEKIIADDLETTITVPVPGLSFPALYVNAEELKKALRVAGKDVVLKREEETLQVGSISLRTGKEEFTTPDFSRMEAVGDPLILPLLKPLLAPAKRAESLDRLSIATIFLDYRNGLAMSTDGARLHCLPLQKSDSEPIRLDYKIAALICGREEDAVVQAWKQTVGEVTDSWVKINLKDGTTVLHRSGEQKFPNYQLVLFTPARTDSSIRLHRAELTSALKAITIGKDASGCILKRTEAGEVVYEKTATELYTKGNLSGAVWNFPADANISFNAQYMLNIIEHMPTQDIVLWRNSEGSPYLITDGNGSCEAFYAVLSR